LLYIGALYWTRSRLLENRFSLCSRVKPLVEYLSRRRSYDGAKHGDERADAIPFSEGSYLSFSS